MATVTLTGFDFAHGAEQRAPGFFKRALDRLIEARERRARLYVNAHLLMLDDETLAAAGFDRKTLEAEGASPYLF
ncbi:MAG: hypothetical protein R3D02_10020 [Hyphomicrobiales bacterium]